jgi:hypothetical protein
MASAVVRTARMVAKVSEANGEVEGRCDEIGVLMSSFSSMLTTIEDRASHGGQDMIMSCEPEAVRR